MARITFYYKKKYVKYFKNLEICKIHKINFHLYYEFLCYLVCLLRICKFEMQIY